MRVTRTAWPSVTSRSTSAPICSGRFRSPKITSGTPMRSARSPSSCAKSEICWMGSSVSRRAASSTASSPDLTRSRKSRSARASIAGDLSHDAEHREQARERFVDGSGDDASGVPDARKTKIGHQKQRGVEIPERRLHGVGERAPADVRDGRNQGEPDRRRDASHVARHHDVRHLRQRAGVQRGLLQGASGSAQEQPAHQRRSLLRHVHHPAQASAAVDLEMDREGRAVGLQHPLHRPLRRHLGTGLHRLHERPQQSPERSRGIRGAELGELPQRLDLLRRKLQRSDGLALLHQAAPRIRWEASASSCSPRGSSTSSGRPFPRTVVPASPLIRSIGAKSGFSTASSWPTSRSTESAKVMPSTSSTANGRGPGGASDGSPNSFASEYARTSCPITASDLASNPSPPRAERSYSVVATTRLIGNPYSSPPTCTRRRFAMETLRGSSRVNREPFPGAERSPILPPRPSTAAFTASRPTPRPERSVASSRVERPGKNASS